MNLPQNDDRILRPTVSKPLSGISDTLNPDPVHSKQPSDDPSSDGTPTYLDAVQSDDIPDLIPAFIPSSTPDRPISQRFPETEYTKQTVEEK
jgi:hypothetical protein